MYLAAPVIASLLQEGQNHRVRRRQSWGTGWFYTGIATPDKAPGQLFPFSVQILHQLIRKRLSKSK